MDWYVAVAGAVVGFVVGLTGMGGGALMTPVLVIFFGIQPLAAVSSDLVASVIMKPVGAAVHARRGTVHRRLAALLCVGSVPSAFAGVLLLRAVGGNDASVQSVVKLSLGIALLVAAAGIVVRTLLSRRRRDPRGGDEIVVRPLPTIAVGVVGGLVVGMTSVGSGSLIIVALMLLYPTLASGRLVGTDLVQAIPLVGSAALGHLMFGEFSLDLTSSLLVGALPAVYLGARVSAVAPAGLVRRALVVVLLVSALKLLQVPTAALLWAAVAGVICAVATWAVPRLASRLAARPDRGALHTG
jgi:uncharacterized membrane protein YfcA